MTRTMFGEGCESTNVKVFENKMIERKKKNQAKLKLIS